MQQTISIGALGGTITMTSPTSGTGARPSLDADALITAVPQLAGLAAVGAATISSKPSASIDIADVLAALDWAGAQVEAGATGVVLTHGTDTLEETAYLLDLLWGRAEPLVLTGAMRAFDQPGTDAAANLLAATRVALDEDARHRGVLVVLNDEIHLAVRVTKTSSTALEAFGSSGFGPTGRILENQVRFAAPAGARPDPLPAPPAGPVDVALVEAPLADDARAVRALLAAGFAGLVVDGGGLGHVSAVTADELAGAVDAGVGVVVASRSQRGGTGRSTYGYPGSETDLIARGVVMTGELSGRKARLLLHVLQCAGVAGPALVDAFAGRSHI